MDRHSRWFVITLAASFAVILFSTSQLCALDHLVSRESMRQALAGAANARQNNIAQVEGFFSSKRVQRVMRKTGVNPKEIQKAVPALSNRELAQLAARARQIQNNFAAGALTNQQLTYIIIAIATAIIVILILKA